ncbi:MAG: threonine synthase [Methylophilaceae bacterium]
MKYISTRGQAPKINFSETLITGLASDGGLYLPENYPNLSTDNLEEFRNLSYSDLAFAIMKLFIDDDDIPHDDLRNIINKTYTKEIFSYTRDNQDSSDITPLTKVDNHLYLLSLSNGPTLAFKDIAMQFLGNIFEYLLHKKNKTLNILGATSGDTGSAAEYAMIGKKGVNVFMLSPRGKMSPFQTAQMYSLQDNNIFNISIDGFFDDCQDIVKGVSNDLDFKNKNQIGAVNSINWGRIIAQVVYYFKGYFSSTNTSNEVIDVTVPSGNFGNICAGHISRMMGLPIRKLVVATNENNVLDEFFKTGVYKPRTSDDTYHTSSPSMDISKASNFERFIFDLIERNPDELRSLWKKIDQGESFDLSNTGYFGKVSNYGFTSSSSSHQNRLYFIQLLHKKYNLIIDTHTADGFKAAFDHFDQTEAIPMVVLETALPTKFEETVMEAIKMKPPRPDGLSNIEQLPQKSFEVDNDINQVKQFIESHS